MNFYEDYTENDPRRTLQIPAGGNSANFTRILEARRIVRRSQSTGRTHQPAEPVNRKERRTYDESIRPQEEAVLKDWALQNGLFISLKEFDKMYSHSYFKSGAEADVYLSDDGRSVIKTNTASYHGTWEDFLDRLVAHKCLFLSTAYELVGFTEKDEGGENVLAAVLRQPFVKATQGATDDEVAAYLSQIGFTRPNDKRSNDYYNAAAGILLEDLHDENVLKAANGILFFIDPVIYFQKPEMKLPGSRYALLPVI